MQATHTCIIVLMQSIHTHVCSILVGAARAAPLPLPTRLRAAVENSIYLNLLFCDHVCWGDRREGLISREAFFEGLIQEERNEFGDAIFALIDPENDETLEFG